MAANHGSSQCQPTVVTLSSSQPWLLSTAANHGSSQRQPTMHNLKQQPTMLIPYNCFKTSIKQLLRLPLFAAAAAAAAVAAAVARLFFS